MKIRTDFVTNSSNSSFILGFKSEQDILNTLLNENTDGNLEEIYNDCINANIMTLEEMLNQYRSEIKWNVRYDIEEYAKHKKKMTYEQCYEWTKTQEFYDLCKKETEKRMESLKLLAEGNQIFVRVVYGDEDGRGHLEHTVIPNLNCCLAAIDHH